MEMHVYEQPTLKSFAFIANNSPYLMYSSVLDTDYSYASADLPVLSSLKNLCVRQMVTANVLSRINCLDLPRTIKDLLMQYAITHCNMKSVTALLNAWKQEVFVFIPPIVFRTWNVFFQGHSPKFFFTILRLSSFLGHFIRHCIASNCENPSPFRCMDFSAFPIGRRHLQQICKAIENCKMFSENLNPHDNVSDPEKIRLDVRDFSNKCVIKISCIIEHKEDIRMLIRAINHVKVHDTPLDVSVTGIHITNINIPSKELLELLNIVEPEALHDFSYFALFPSPQSKADFGVIRELRSFRNLRSLALQLNSGCHSELFIELHDILHQMKNLKALHLDQWSARLSRTFDVNYPGDIISMRLPFATEQLEYLELTGWSLSTDFASISTPVHALKTLNISYANLDLQSLIPLLTACTNLHVLIHEKCEFTGGNIDLLFQKFSTMEKLKGLNIKKINVSTEDLLNMAFYVSRMSSLKCLAISSNFEKNVDLQRNFKKKFQCAVDSLWCCPSRRIVMF